MLKGASHDFQYLQEISAHYRRKARPLPALKTPDVHWSALLFQLGDYRFVCQQAFIHEVLALPSFAALPSANDWVLGVANLRGALLPLVDLGAFVGQPSKSTRQRRVMVCRHQEQWLGLVVDTVMGVQRLKDEQVDQEGECPLTRMQPYAHTSILIRHHRYWVMTLEALLNDPAFMAVGRPLEGSNAEIQTG
jgi:twitching motility protein PilI